MRRLSIHLLPSPPCPCSSWWWFWVYHSPGPSASPWACPPWWPAAAEQGGVNITGDQVRISPHHPHHKVGWSEARKVGGEWQNIVISIDEWWLYSPWPWCRTGTTPPSCTCRPRRTSSPWRGRAGRPPSWRTPRCSAGLGWHRHTPPSPPPSPGPGCPHTALLWSRGGLK